MGTRFGDSTVLAAARDAIDKQAARYQKARSLRLRGVSRLGQQLQPAGRVLREHGQPAQRQLRRLRPRAARLRSKSIALLLDRGLPTAHDGNPRTARSGFFPGDPIPRERSSVVSNGRPDRGMNQNSGCMDAQKWPTSWPRTAWRTIVVAPGQLDPDTADCLAESRSGRRGHPPYLHPASNPSELIAEIGDITRTMAKRLPARSDDRRSRTRIMRRFSGRANGSLATARAPTAGN